MKYQSETSTCRGYLKKWCVGNGIDIGAGGDAIVPRAICIDREDGAASRADTGDSPTHIVADMADLYMFADNALSWAFSSHALEDAYDTVGVLNEWVRVVKPGGHIILFLPDEQTYRAYCAKTGHPYNGAHVHSHFSLQYIKECVAKIHGVEIVDSVWPFPGNNYSFSCVIKKL